MTLLTLKIKRIQFESVLFKMDSFIHFLRVENKLDELGRLIFQL